MAERKYIANVADNRQLYKKAYLIEFSTIDGTSTETAFTFSFPPESEELTYGQRKMETKTFAGLHVDDYGIDAVKIVLSGSTINQELRLIYGGDEKKNKWLSGEEEIYYLRDLIQKYKTGVENLRKKIIIYDLSKVIGENEAGNWVKNYWQAFPGDFKIRRASDRPFTYKYTFEFTGIPLEEGQGFTSHGEPPKLDETKPDLMRAIMEKLIKALDFVDGINARINDVLDEINRVAALLRVLGNVMSYSANTLSGSIDSAGDTAAGLLDGVAAVVGGATSVISLPRTVQLKVLNVGLELQNAAGGLVKATSALVKNCRDMFTGEYWEIPQEVLDQSAVNNEEFKDSIRILLNQAETTACEIAAAAKSGGIPEVTVGNPGRETGEQRIVLSYGYTALTLKTTDTIEGLANKYLGSPDKAIDIAAYNGIASVNDLEPGDTIRIPITLRAKRMAQNLIFSRREDRDNYGRDIMLTDDGFMIISPGGDFELTKGVHNLSQAVLLRLRENVARRIRLNAYGIRTNISDPAVGRAYITASIDLTVKSDPRVASVDAIRLKGAGDHLIVDVDYSDINNADRKAAGRV